jgi:thiol:disulfide interchange protein DsbD
VAAAVHAQTASPGEGLLPVTQAFALKATIARPGAVTLHFDIAPHYYLYRGRIHAKILTPGVAAGALQTPPGTQEHDPYLGDVEIYHDAVDASLPYTAAGS